MSSLVIAKGRSHASPFCVRSTRPRNLRSAAETRTAALVLAPTAEAAENTGLDTACILTTRTVTTFSFGIQTILRRRAATSRRRGRHREDQSQRLLLRLVAPLAGWARWLSGRSPVSLSRRFTRKVRPKEAPMRVLMVITSHDQLGNTGRKTGFWLEELAAPYYVFKDAGVDLTLASPKGGQPPIDPKSDLPENQTDAMSRFKKDNTAQADLAHTVPLDSVKSADFDTVFYVGGHGPMWDLAESPVSI